MKRLEAALKVFGPGFHVYQYLFKSNRPDIPFATYDDPIVEAAIDQRRKFFEARREHLYQIEIFYCILLEGTRSKTGVGTALARLLRDPEGAIAELKSQFTNDNMKTLLRKHIERDLQRLDQHVQAFARQLADFMQIEVLNPQGQFRFFRRLLNYDDWRIAGRPQSTQFLDYQVVNSDIEAERDDMRVRKLDGVAQFGDALQRFYTPTYIRSSIAGSISTGRRNNYRMLMLAARGIQPRPATNTDVTDGTTPQPGGKPIPLALSQPALQRGYTILYLGPEQRYIDASLSAYLRSAVYGSDGLFDLYKPPLLFGLLSLVIQLPFSIAKDVRRRKALRYGRRLKGPEMMTPREFNDRVAGDGIGIKTKEMKTMIRIPQRAEAQHMQIIGDTGAGKT